jgi:hypothetical protein
MPDLPDLIAIHSLQVILDGLPPDLLLELLLGHVHLSKKRQ